MLVIRPDQFKAFQPQAEAAFREQVASYLLDKHAGVTVRAPGGNTTVKDLPPEVLGRLVENGIARARQYGLTWESNLTAFVVLLFVAAPNFDSHPLVQPTLKDQSVPPDLRIDKLWKRLSESEWEDVRKRYDPAAWGSAG